MVGSAAQQAAPNLRDCKQGTIHFWIGSAPLDVVSRERDLDVDEEYDVDGGLEMYENRNSKVTKEKAVKRQRTSQITDLRKTNNALDNCNLCFGSAKLSRHLIVALGQTAYLSIPERYSTTAWLFWMHSPYWSWEPGLMIAQPLKRPFQIQTVRHFQCFAVWVEGTAFTKVN